MAEAVDAEQLLETVAERAGISPDILVRLLDLESAFPDFTIHGSKTNFARRVAAILDTASKPEGDPA